MLADLAVEVKDSVFDPDNPDPNVPVKRQAGKRPLYRVFLYLDGPGLPYVERVTYQLHSTFEQPNRVVQRTLSNPRCKLEIWTWGLFRVQATVVDKSGRTHVLYHDLNYDQAFESGQISFTAA